MPVTAKSVIQRVVGTLQDETSVRWTIPELVRYLNDGQREIIVYRPDATIRSDVFTCTVGTKQTLPTDAAKLLDVRRNTAVASNMGVVRMVNREILDAQIPSWHTLAGTVDIKHFMYDARDPKTFYVYPPAAVGAELDISYSAFPIDVAEPAAGSTYDGVVGNIDVPDIYANAIADYILFRAYSKDAEYTGNAQRATAHYAAFANALGIEIKATVSAAPAPAGSPNV